MNSGQSSPDLEVAAAFSGLEGRSSKQPLTIAEERSSTCTIEDSLSECSECSCPSKLYDDSFANYKLHYFAGCGKLKEMTELLSNGANADSLDGNGNTPLSWAASQNQVALGSVLLQHGASPNGRSRIGSPPLCYAACHGFLRFVELLVRNDCYIDDRNRDGCTALMYAAYSGHRHVVSYLLNKGSDFTLQNRWGDTALSLAAARNHPQTVKCFDDYIYRMLGGS